MASTNAVWGIEVGQCALKALKLRGADGGKVEAVAFDLIEHAKLLSQPDAEPDELIRAALEKFVSRNDWQGDRFVIGVPGQQTFARFCKLPPVDPKKIPDIVRFEAGQQIPFDMDDVVWDYQVFTAEDSPDVEVGIFAIRKDLMRKHIEFFTDVGIGPTAVQALPSALYNFCRYDLQEDNEGGATVVIDVGAQNTDLIVTEANSAWSRNIPLGGNSFTEALIKSFKLSFAKAESLKRTAATSKYARQIFQAMRPVFAELVAEIQRSIGFYSSTHRDVELKRVLALGNAFRLPGLQKYLENNLTIPGGVTKLEKFNQLVPSATINAPQFADNILSFGAAYGLALQGLGLASIQASLLPPELARIAVWNKKRPWFGAAAACLALAAVCPWARQFMDKGALAAADDPVRRQTTAIISEAEGYRTRFQAVKTDTGGREQDIQQLLQLQEQRSLIPQIMAIVHEAMPEVAPELAQVQTANQLKQLIASDPVRFARTKRRQLVIESCKIEYQPDIDSYQPKGFGAASAGPGMAAPQMMLGGGGRRTVAGGSDGWSGVDTSASVTAAKAPGFYVHLVGRMLYGDSRAAAAGLLAEDYYPRLRTRGQRPGLGCYVPNDDPKDKDSQAFAQPQIDHYYEQAGPGSAVAPGRSMMGGGRMGGGAATPTPAETDGPAFQDSVTKEDMSTDWRFEFGFKLKMGEMPKDESGETKNEE